MFVLDTVLEIDGKLCFDSTKIAQHFNEFFINIASKLVDKLPKCSNMFSVASSAFQDYMVLSSTTPTNFIWALFVKNSLKRSFLV